MDWQKEVNSILESQVYARSFQDFMGPKGVYTRWQDYSRWCKYMEACLRDQEYRLARLNEIKALPAVTQEQNQEFVRIEALEQELTQYQKLALTIKESDVEQEKRNFITEAEKMASSNDELLKLVGVWYHDFHDSERAMTAMNTAIAKASSVAEQISCALEWISIFSSPGNAHQQMTIASAKSNDAEDLIKCAEIWLVNLNNETESIKCIVRAKSAGLNESQIGYAVHLLNKFKSDKAFGVLRTFEQRAAAHRISEKVNEISMYLLVVWVGILSADKYVFNNQYSRSIAEGSLVVLILFYCGGKLWSLMKKLAWRTTSL